MEGHTILRWCARVVVALSISCAFPLETMAASIGTSQAHTPVDCMETWLVSIGISPSKADNYTRLFMQEEIEERSLESMTMEQLEAAGIRALGPRSVIFNAAQTGIDVCKFGGTCDLVDSSFRCSCQSGTSGSLCEKLTACPPDFCVNGGSCSLTGDNASCSCLSGYSGVTCQISGHCGAQPCKHGGMCIEDSASVDGYSCKCPLGYTGIDCEDVWFSEEILTDLETRMIRLSRNVMGVQSLQLFLHNQAGALKSQAASLRSTMEEVNGPKLFTKWASLHMENAAITDVTSLQVQDRDLLAVLTDRISVFEIARPSASVSFVLLQTLSNSDGATTTPSRAVTTLALANDRYVVGVGDTSGLHRWNAMTQRFDKIQDIATEGALHVEHVTVESLDFLIFACRGPASYVYVWSDSLDRFLLYQRLPTTGAVRASGTQSTETGTFVTITQRTSEPRSNTVVVFKWNGTYFDSVQSFRSDSAHVFAAEACVFLADASNVRRYDSAVGKFVHHTSLPGQHNASGEYEHLSLNTEQYLATVGSSTESSRSEVVNVYRLAGAGLALHQTIANATTGGTPTLRGLKLSGGRANVLALVNGGTSVALWKWTTCINP